MEKLLDFYILLFTLSTTLWLVKLQSYLSKRYPRLEFIALTSSFFSSLVSVIYLSLRSNKILPEGFGALFFSIDNAIGLFFLFSISLLLPFYIVIPIVELFSKNSSKSNDDTNTTNINKIYGVIILLFIGFTIVLVFNYFKVLLFGNCTQEPDIFCVRFSTFSNYINSILPLNIIFVQALALIGAIASILGAVKTGQQIIKNLNTPKINLQDIPDTKKVNKNKSKRK